MAIKVKMKLKISNNLFDFSFRKSLVFYFIFIDDGLATDLMTSL